MEVSTDVVVVLYLVPRVYTTLADCLPALAPGQVSSERVAITKRVGSDYSRVSQQDHHSLVRRPYPSGLLRLCGRHLLARTSPRCHVC